MPPGGDGVLVVGDVVRLKSGGEPMTVSHVRAHDVTCTWMSKAGVAKTGRFEIKLLNYALEFYDKKKDR
jgi:uncharacterized protein YodC (DUF2158 family)